MIITLVPAFHKRLELILNPTPPPSAQLCRTWALVHVEEYVLIVHALAPNTHVAPSDETMGILYFLHPTAEVDLPPFMNDFHLEMKVILNRKTFIFVLAHSPYLFSSGPLGMVYELLRDCFAPDDFASGFNLFFEICRHIVQGRVPPSISRSFFTSRLLVLKKQSGNIRSIIIDEVTYHFVACTLTI
jgi:hypothetical protein